jgi:hypothetical protein
MKKKIREGGEREREREEKNEIRKPGKWKARLKPVILARLPVAAAAHNIAGNRAFSIPSLSSAVESFSAEATASIRSKSSMPVLPGVKISNCLYFIPVVPDKISD